MPRRIALTALLLAGLAAQLVLGVRSLAAAFHATRGEALQARGDHEAARQAYHRANRALPFESERFRLEAAATRESLGPTAAAAIYARAVQLAPASPLLLVTAAENLLAAGDSNAAARLLDSCRDLVPDDWRAHHLRGTIFMGRRQYAEAAEEFRAASEFASPYQAEVSHQLARALLALDDHAGALKEIGRAITARPLSPEFYQTRGQIFFSQGKYAEAKRDFGWTAASLQRRARRGADFDERIAEAKALLKAAQDALAATPQ